MTVEEAEKIMHNFGKFLEVANGSITSLFMSGVPEALLPYPKDKIVEALETAKRVFHERGESELENLMDVQLSALTLYTNNDTALAALYDKLKDPDRRKAFMSVLGRTQERQYKSLVEG